MMQPPGPAELRHSAQTACPEAKISYLVGLFGAVEKTRTFVGWSQRPNKAAQVLSARASDARPADCSPLLDGDANEVAATGDGLHLVSGLSIRLS